MALQALLVGAFPLVIPVVAIVAIATTMWVPIRRAVVPSRGVPTITGLAIRSGWLAIAVVGLVALVHDVQALT